MYRLCIAKPQNSQNGRKLATSCVLIVLSYAQSWHQRHHKHGSIIRPRPLHHGFDGGIAGYFLGMGEVCFVDEFWRVQHSPHVAAGFVEFTWKLERGSPKIANKYSLAALYPPRSEKMVAGRHHPSPSELATSWRSAFTSWRTDGTPIFYDGLQPLATSATGFSRGINGIITNVQKQRLWHKKNLDSGHPIQSYTDVEKKVALLVAVECEKTNFWPWAPEHPRHGHFGAKRDLLLSLIRWLVGWLGHVGTLMLLKACHLSHHSPPTCPRSRESLQQGGSKCYIRNQQPTSPASWTSDMWVCLKIVYP